MQSIPAAAAGPGPDRSGHRPETTGQTESLAVPGSGPQHGRRSGYAVVVASAALGLVLCLLGAVLSPWFSLALSILLALVIAWGWPAASGAAELRGAKSIPSHSVVIALAGTAAAVVVVASPSTSPGGTITLSLLPAVVAVGVVSCFIAELLRGEGAFARLESVISGTAGVLSAVSASGWIGMADFYAHTHAQAAVWAVGAGVALLIGLVGGRMVSAGPVGGPRRGAVVLGLVPVAFFGIIGYAGAVFFFGVLA